MDRKKLSILPLFFVLFLALTPIIKGAPDGFVYNMDIDLEDGDDTYVLDDEYPYVQLYFDWDSFVMYPDNNFNVTVSDSGGNIYVRMHWSGNSPYEMFYCIGGDSYSSGGGDYWGTSEKVFDTVGTHPTGTGYLEFGVVISDELTPYAYARSSMTDSNFNDAYTYHRVPIYEELSNLFDRITIEGCAGLTDDTGIIEVYVSDEEAEPTEADEATADILDIFLGEDGIGIPLLVILFCAFLGYHFAETVGFIAGLNLGIMVAYLLLDFPAWTMIVCIIIDVMYFYGGKE